MMLSSEQIQRFLAAREAAEKEWGEVVDPISESGHIWDAQAFRSEGDVFDDPPPVPSELPSFVRDADASWSEDLDRLERERGPALPSTSSQEGQPEVLEAAYQRAFTLDNAEYAAYSFSTVGHGGYILCVKPGASLPPLLEGLHSIAVREQGEALYAFEEDCGWAYLVLAMPTFRDALVERYRERLEKDAREMASSYFPAFYERWENERSRSGPA